MTYDPAEKTVTFTVVADSNGVLSVTGPTYTEANPVQVTNTYNTGDLEISIPARRSSTVLLYRGR